LVFRHDKGSSFGGAYKYLMSGRLPFAAAAIAAVIGADPPQTRQL
jgi:hypothetical protein